MFCQNCGVQLPPVASVPPPPPTPVLEFSGQSQQAYQGSAIRSKSNDSSEPQHVKEKGPLLGWLILRDKGVELPLLPDQKELVIGRTDPVQNIYPDVDLAEHDGERNGVSRRHARILLRSDGVYLEDLNSTNFTFLNNNKLYPGQPYPLKYGDEIRLGLLTLEYRS